MGCVLMLARDIVHFISGPFTLTFHVTLVSGSIRALEARQGRDFDLGNRAVPRAFLFDCV